MLSQKASGCILKVSCVAHLAPSSHFLTISTDSIRNPQQSYCQLPLCHIVFQFGRHQTSPAYKYIAVCTMYVHVFKPLRDHCRLITEVAGLLVVLDTFYQFEVFELTPG